MLFNGTPFYDIMRTNKTTNKTKGKRMKKLLNISVIAALAILPMAANAAVGEIVSVTGPATATSANQADNDVTATAGPKYALATEGANDGNLATAGYVKGAYNETMKAINKVAETAGNALTANGTATLTNKTIDADDNTIQDLEADNFKSGVIVTEVGATGTDTSLPTEQAVREAITTATTDMVTTTGTQTLTNKTIDANSNSLSNVEVDNFNASAIVDQDTDGGISAATSASDTALVTEKAVATAIETATTGQVTLNGTQTLTNKTIDADDNTISDLTTSNLKSGTLVDSTTGIATDGSASDAKLVSEAAVADAIADFATQDGVENTVETATITANVPTLTTWGNDSSTSTVAIQNVSITATYAEP